MNHPSSTNLANVLQSKLSLVDYYGDTDKHGPALRELKLSQSRASWRTWKPNLVTCLPNNSTARTVPRMCSRFKSAVHDLLPTACQHLADILDPLDLL